MNLKVLIVDDAAFIREIIRNILEDQSVEILPDAADGEEAIKIIKKHKPDIVFLDIAMPKKSGLHVCEEALRIDPNIHIYAVSSLHEESIIQRAIEAGCTDFIKKPFEVNDILEKVQKVINKKEAANG